MSQTLKACTSLFKIRVAENLQYRAAAIANASISIFWGFLQIAMFTVFFTLGDAKGTDMTLPQAISYTWLAQTMLGFIGRLDIDSDLREKITSGNVALDLCRPLDLYAHWYAKTIANRVGGSVWRAALTLLVALIIPATYRLSAPSSALGFLLFTASICSAILLCTAFAMFISAVRVGLTWGEGPTFMFSLLGSVLSGVYLPLQLWPDFMQQALLLQPFAGLMDIPFRLYLGLIAPHEGFFGIGLQIFWTAVFVLAGRILLKQRVTTLIVQGG